MIKVLIADDHKMFVDGIDSILTAENDIEVVGRCYDGPSVIEFIDNNEVDLLLLDVNLPGMTGIEVCKSMRESGKKTNIIAISMFNEESFVTEILNNGAQGYILKNTGRDELLVLIPKVSRREKEVLRLIVQEHTTQEIADKLFISLKTVESHRSSLLGKLDARNSAGLVRITLENNLLD